MRVTEIRRERGHLVRLCFEDGESALLDCDTVAEDCIHEDDILSEEKLKRLKSASDYARAKSRALWLLDRYTYTERRLFDKLKQAGFGEEPSRKAVHRLKELGLVDDNALSVRFAQDCARRGISKREAYSKLLLKGFSSETVKTALNSAAFDEKNQLELLIRKKYKSKILSGETDKVYAALIRKGFSYNAVREALKEYSEELEYLGDV